MRIFRSIALIACVLDGESHQAGELVPRCRRKQIQPTKNVREKMQANDTASIVEVASHVHFCSFGRC